MCQELNDDPIGQLMSNMIATFVEVEREMIAERLRDAKAAKRQRGLRCAGLVPYGFAAVPSTRQLTPVPAERKVVHQIFERAAAGSARHMISSSTPICSTKSARRSWHGAPGALVGAR